MKEKLIAYTRTDKNVEKVKQKSLIAFIIWAIIVMLFSNNVDAKDPTWVEIVIAVLLDTSFLIGLTWLGVVNELSKKTPEIIKRNTILTILLANEDVVETVLLILSMMIFHFIMCVCVPGSLINPFRLFIGIAAILVLAGVMGKYVSRFFEKKLKT